MRATLNIVLVWTLFFAQLAMGVTPPTTDPGIINTKAVTTPTSPSSGRSKLYLKSDGNWYTLNSSGAEKRVGDGSVLDVFYSEDFESISAPGALTTGNNATILGGGSIAGTLSNETSAPLNGLKSFKYVQAGGSLNDYFCGPVTTIYPKQRSATANDIGMNFSYSYDGASGDIGATLWDVTNSIPLTSTLDVLALATSSTPYSTAAHARTNTASVRWCFQVKVLNSGKTLIWDDLELSTNPYVRKNIVASQYIYHTAAGSTLITRTTVELNLANVISSGDSILTPTNTGSRTRFTANRKAKVFFNFDAVNDTVANHFNAQKVGTPNMVKNGVDAAGSNYHAQVDGSFDMNTGDYFYFEGDAASAVRNSAQLVNISITALAESDAVVTPQIGADSSVELTGSTSYGSTATKIRVFTTALVAGTALTYAVDSTLGSRITVSSSGAGTYQICYTDEKNSAGQTNHGISKNASSLTTNINSLADAQKLALTTTNGSSNNYATVCTTRPLVAGDIIRPHSDGANTNSASPFFSMTRVGYKSLSANPGPIVCFLKDVKADTTVGGTFTSGAWQTRVLNTINENGSVTSGSCPFMTLNGSNQFTIQPGEYTIAGDAPAHRVNAHKLKVRNITDSTDDIIGRNAWSDSGDTTATTATIMGKLSLATTKTYELQHRCSATFASTGFGRENSFGVPEIYSQLKVIKWR